MIKLYPCLHIFSELEICALEFPWEIVFDVISGNYLYLKLLENAKGIILVNCFYPLKTECPKFPLY